MAKTISLTPFLHEVSTHSLLLHGGEGLSTALHPKPCHHLEPPRMEPLHSYLLSSTSGHWPCSWPQPGSQVPAREG